MMNRQKLFYLFIRALVFPISYLPYFFIHHMGKFFGSLLYHLLRDFRKRALANLALATDLDISTQELPLIAKKSFQNLAITILEYGRFAREKDFSSIIECVNPQETQSLYEKGQGMIFFCGHQANWEVLFLDGNLHMKGTAMGKPIKNPYLYRWIVSIREKTGGKIIDPKNALKEGLRTLKKGEFLGIVGDQSMPTSHYFFPFFGRKAWTSTAPALLAYRTKCPILVATTIRKNGKYFIHYSDPIWPNLKAPSEEEIPKLMDQSLSILQESIRKHPDQWLWQHNRYKQQTPHRIYKQYRHDSILLILPEDPEEIEKVSLSLKILRGIYESAFFFVLKPKNVKSIDFLHAEEEYSYQSHKNILLDDYRFKLVFNFSRYSNIKSHFLSYSAYDVISLSDIAKRAKNMGCYSHDLSDQLIKILCREGTFDKRSVINHAS